MEFQQLMTPLAIQMVVLLVPVSRLEDGAARNSNLRSSPAWTNSVEHAIHRGAADVPRLPFGGQLFNQLVSVEVLVTAKDVFEQHAALLGTAIPRL